MRAIVCRSWGFEEDRSFVALASDVPEPACEPARKLVVVSNGADRPWPVRARQTKQLARGAFERCVTALAAAFADREIVEVGTGAAGPPIGGVRDLRGQTTLAELIALLARAEAIVCLEGGIAHLAAALRRPALVLAGPTSERNYGHGLHTYVSSGSVRAVRVVDARLVRRLPARASTRCAWPRFARRPSSRPCGGWCEPAPARG